MRWVSLVVILCACNRAFGLDQARPWDAAPDVPATDAKPLPVCPAIGTAPTFGIDLRQIPARGCWSYSISPDTKSAGALCNGGFVSVGEPDAMLAQVPLSPDPGPFYNGAQLSPEGDSFYLAVPQMVDPFGVEVVEYVFTTGNWVRKRLVYLDLQWIQAISPPTRAPDRRIVVVHYDGTGMMGLHEFRDTGTTWQSVGTITADSVGMITLDGVTLSADGRRMIFVGTENQGGQMGTFFGPRTFYMDRADITQPFSAPKLIDSVPSGILWPYMTEDCGRIYFAALDTVFYLSQ